MNKPFKPPGRKQAPAPKPAYTFRAPLAVRSANTVGGGPEKKNIDTTENLVLAFGSVNAVRSTLLTPIAQGTTATSRLGRKIRLTKLNFRWFANLGTTTTGGSPIRMKCVYDKQTNGAAPAVTDVMTADLFESPNNLDNSDRFITLFDEITEPISVQNNYCVGGQINRVLDLEQMWLSNTATGVITSMLTGSIYLFVWHTGTLLTANANFSYICRTRFVDN